jgi:dihydroorotase
MIGLETAYAAVRTALPELTAERTVALFSGNARTIFGMEKPSITENSAARLSLFNPDGETEVTTGLLRSTSANTAFMGKTLKGSVTGIVTDSHIVINE